MAEIAGDARRASPEDIEQIAAAIETVLGDEGLAQPMRARFAAGEDALGAHGAATLAVYTLSGASLS
jgi:hypothetical protein